jgi:Zn-dependent metalloprotease
MISKPKRFSLLLIFLCLVIGFVVIRKHAPNINSNVPPIQQVKTFPLSNAPSIAAETTWSTNVPAAVSNFVAGIKQKSNQNQAANILNPTKGTYVQFKNRQQETAFDQLKQTSGSAQLFLRPDNSTPIQIKGYPLMKAIGGGGALAEQNAKTANAFLQENASLLLLNDPSKELRVLANETDNLGMINIRYAQTYAGLDVWPAQLSVHLDAQGNVAMLDGAYIATPEGVATVPQISQSEAETRAKSLVSGGELANGSKPALIIYGPLDKPPRLGWKSEVVSGLQNDWIVVIDALDGSTLTAFNQVADANVAGSGVDLLGQTRSLNVWQNGSTYFMLDTGKSMFNSTSGSGYIRIYDATNQNINNLTLGSFIDITSLTPASWNNPDGVSAAFNFSQTYDYYHTRFGRDSYNGLGSNMLAIVRISSYPNASWHNDIKMMLFGNADRYAASLDVIGHELTHGVTGSIGGNGVLVYQDQSGALNEAFSDIFGEMIEARTQGTNDWLIGTQLSSPLRNLANPSAYQISGLNVPYPSKYSQFISPTDSRLNIFVNKDNGGVHENSTIFGHAYYMLAAGIKDAIGTTNAEKIFYRCLTQSMQPQSQFIDARLGCIAAAETLFGTNSVYALKTAEAFDDVEIYAAPASTTQSNMNAAVAAPDSYMWVRDAWDWSSLSYKNSLFRYESALGDSGSGTALVTGVEVAMPSVAGNGSDMYFVGTDSSLCHIQTSGSGFSTSNSGLVHSVAWSPGQRYFAFILNASSGSPTNQIYLYDSLNGAGATVSLQTPVQDGPALNNVSYADALSFSPDGKYLAYDALSTVKMPDGSLNHAWSVYALTLSTLQQSLLAPSSSGFSFGNPAFSRTSDRYLVIDALSTNGNSAILTLDLALGNAGLIGVSQAGLGYPQFNGDDSFVIFADSDSTVNSGRSIYAQNLSADKMSTSGNRTLWISDAFLATVYRRGTYTTPYTPPAVALTSPTPNASYSSPANVTLTATASSPNGTISRVEFYTGSKLLGTITSSPYSGVWTNVPSGNYRVYARVYDSTGASTTSTPVDFTIHPPALTADFVRAGKTGFEFSLRVPQAGLYRLEYSTNLVNWTTLGTFQCVSNLDFLDSAATNRPQCFYRAVSSP